MMMYISHIYTVDNHDSGYLGMAVQLYVQAHLGHYHLDPEGIQPKIDGRAEIYAPFTFNNYAQFELLKTCRKHNTTICKSTCFVLTD